jgi:Flp pilus assembly protein TadG
MMMKTNLETRGQRGAAMIEFALVLPLLLIVLLGTVEFSFILYNKAMITNASREGARLGIVYEIDGSTGDRAGADIARCDGVAARAQQYLKKRLVTFDDRRSCCNSISLSC